MVMSCFVVAAHTAEELAAVHNLSIRSFHEKHADRKKESSGTKCHICSVRILKKVAQSCVMYYVGRKLIRLTFEKNPFGS